MDAYEMGYKAWYNDLGTKDNPFDLNSDDAWLWETGWWMGFHDYRKLYKCKS